MNSHDKSKKINKKNFKGKDKLKKLDPVQD